jgi:hypothetical protein
MHQLTQPIAPPSRDLQLTVTRRTSETELHHGAPYYVVESGSTFIAMICTWNGLWWVTFRDAKGTLRCSDLETAIAAVLAQAEQVLATVEVEAHVEAIAAEVAPEADGVDVALYTLGFQAALLRSANDSNPSFRKGFSDGKKACFSPLPTKTLCPVAIYAWGDELLNADF